MAIENDAVLICKSSMDNFKICQYHNYEIGYYLQTAPTKQICEDALLVHVVGKEILVAVCDGVGGSEKSYRAAIKVLEELQQLEDLGDQLLMLDVLSFCNHELMNLPGQPQTTLTAAVLGDNSYYCLQVGDSGLVHCGGRGKLKYKSPIHSLVGQALARAEISEAQALHHPDLHIVDNVVGHTSFYAEASRFQQFKAHDTVLLTSDGLLDNFTSEQLIAMLQGRSMVNVCQTLTSCCVEYQNRVLAEPFYKIDDISFIVVKRMGRVQ